MPSRLTIMISIHSTRVGGDPFIVLSSVSSLISIHSTRVGGDLPTTPTCRFFSISIHSTRVGGDSGFQQQGLWRLYFNPLHPCGRRRCLLRFCTVITNFNPLHPCGRRREFLTTSELSRLLFQSTPPVWAETYSIDHHQWLQQISIHSTRVGGDSAFNGL